MMRQGRGSRIESGAGAAGSRESAFTSMRAGRHGNEHGAAASVEAEELKALWRAERLLARRYAKAVECARDFGLRRLWRAAHADAEKRAAKLARRLDPDTIPPTDGESDCFIDAMDLALGNGDLAAAEIVARTVAEATRLIAGASNRYKANEQDAT